MSKNICHNYHAEDNTCGIDGGVCMEAECMFNNYKEAPLFQDEANKMVDEYGNVNWRLAFSMS